MDYVVIVTGDSVGIEVKLFSTYEKALADVLDDIFGPGYDTADEQVAAVSEALEADGYYDDNGIEYQIREEVVR